MERFSVSRPAENVQHADVVEETQAAGNRIRQAAILADDLEEPRTHVLAEHGVEQPQREAPFVVPRASADAERELRLLGFFGEEVDARRGLFA